MPNSVVDFYRTQFPEDKRPDDAITWEYIQQYGPDKLTQFPDLLADYNRIDLALRKTNPPSIWKEFTHGVGSGVDTAEANLYGALALGGAMVPDALGSKAITQFGDEGYQRNLAEAAQNPATIQKVEEISNPMDFLRFGVSQAGQQVPQAALTIGGAALGELAGGPAGAAVLGSRLSGALAAPLKLGSLSKVIGEGRTLGQVLGGEAANFTQMQNYEQLKNTPGVDPASIVPTAIGVGLVGGALEELPVLRFMGKLWKPAEHFAKDLTPLKALNPVLKHLPDNEVTRYLGRVLKEVPAQAVLEGSTEVLQEITTMAGEEYANRNNPNFKLTPAEIQTRLINNGVAGALLGGAAGTIEAIPNHAAGPITTPPPPIAAAAEPAIVAQPQAPGIPDLGNVGTVTAPAGPPSVESVAASTPPPNPVIEAARNYAANPDLTGFNDATWAATLGAGQANAARPVGAPVAGFNLQAANELAGAMPDPVREALMQSARSRAAIVPEFYPGDPFAVPVAQAPPLVAQTPVIQTPAPIATVPTSLPEQPVQTETQTKGEPNASQIGNIQQSNQQEYTDRNQGGTSQSPGNSDQLAESRQSPPEINTPASLLAAVDFDNSVLRETKTTQGRAGAEAVRQPAFFTVHDQSFSPALAERLVSDAKATQAKKSDTRRVTFFEDQETGAVVGLPTWYTSDSSRGGKTYRVTNPEEGSGQQLQTFMASGRYVPVASVRLKQELSGTDKANVYRFDDFKAFEDQFLKTAREIGKASANYITTPMHGFEGGNIIEKVAPVVENEGALQVFQSSLIEQLAKSGGLTEPHILAALVRVAADPKVGYTVRAEIADRALHRDPAIIAQLMALPTDNERQTFLIERLANILYDEYSKAGIRESSGLQEFIGHGGGSAGRSGTLYSIPETQPDGRATNGAVKARFAGLNLAVQTHGLTVNIVQAIGKEIGSFSGKERKITLALHDAQNPTPDNLRLLLHEVAHDVSRGLPDAVRAAVHRAIDSYTDEALGIASSTDPRIRGSNPAGLDPTTLSEERLAEHLALALLDRPAASGIASQIVRFVKALYYRMAMALQTVFGREPSQALATAYVRNRFEQVTAGDRMGLFRFLIPPVQPGAYPDYYSTPGGLNEERRTADPKIEVQSRIAALNEQIDLEKQVNDALTKDVPNVVAAAKEDGMSPGQWFREAMGFQDPALLIQKALGRIDEETGLLVTAKPDHRITDFEAPQNRQVAALDAQNLIKKLYETVSVKVTELFAKIETTEEAREAASRKLEKESATPKIPLPDNEEAARLLKVDKWKRQVKKLAGERDELQRQHDAASHVVFLYKQKKLDMDGLIGNHEPFIFGHNAKYIVPTKDGFTTKTLKLDANGEITARSEVHADIDKMDAWLETAPKDGNWFHVQAIKEEFAKHQVSVDAREMGYIMPGLMFSDMATQMKAQGTPASRRVAQLINKFNEQMPALRGILNEKVIKVQRAGEAAMQLLKDGSRDYYQRNFYNPAADFLESRADLAEKYSGSFTKQLDAAMSVLRKKFMDESENKERALQIAGKEDAFFKLLRAHLESTNEVIQYMVQHNVDNNIHVQDEKTGGERHYITRGIMTVPQVLSDYFPTVFQAMRELWAAASAEFATFGQTFNSMGPDVASQSVAHFFADDTIQRGFLKALIFDVKNGTPFFGPLLGDGVTRPMANPGFLREAFKESGGDVVRLFMALHQKHEGTENLGAYIQKNLMVLARYFGEMRKVMEQMDGPGLGAPKTLANMIPGFMIHSREIEHWPSSWVDHVMLDERSAPRITEKMAAQNAFGPENRDLVRAYTDFAQEHKQAVKKLAAAISIVKQTNPSAKRKVLELALAEAVGGKEELARLRKIQKLGAFVDGGHSVAGQLITYFSNRHPVTKELAHLNNLSSAFATAMVNQPGSAISQMAELGSGFVTFGFNPQGIRHVLTTTRDVAKELGYGLVEAFGISVQRADREFQRAVELGQGDSEGAKKAIELWKQGDSPLSGESNAGLFLRKVRNFTRIVTSAKSPLSAGGHIQLTPFGLFGQINKITHLSAVVNATKVIQDMVMRGVEWATANPDQFGPHLADLDMRGWSDLLGFKGLSRDGFTRIFQRLLDDHAIDYYSLVKKGLNAVAKGTDVIDNKTSIAINGMWIKAASSQSNISTMSSAAFNNSVLRFMIPLLGWGWQRAVAIPRWLLLNEKGQRASLAGFSKSLIGLTALAGTGLAVSSLVDLYNEELLKKRRNLRRLSLDQDMSNLAYAILEHSARIGTFGLLGDVTNAMVNVGSGQGDNRGISLDGRVVFVNSTLGLVRSISNFINQDFEADYMNVIRPAMFAVGGNGALQYMQLANNMFGLDNMEARAVSRTNVGNWLRVAGREVGMEINTSSQGGFSSPTPRTPLITKMQLAALADDRDGFMQAYQEAIAQAREAGAENPADAIRKSFSSRNPLRSIFRTTPTEQDYRKILAALPDQGREDVSTAINLFNRYGASIGVQPFDGKPAPSSLHSLHAGLGLDRSALIQQARSRAAFF